ncbi:reverse transcriptase domain-containing protein [Tanacetum coccineum]
MHIRCGRRSIPRPRRQHARNQSLPREGGSGNEATITLNIERSSKPKREAGEFKQILVQIRRKITPLLQNFEKMEAVSAVLLAERDSRKVPVYFVSRALQTPKINYSSMENLVLALVHATRRLGRYFQAHPVVFELEAFDISYRPNTSIRGQILADFIVEKPNEEGPLMEVQTEEAIPEPWTLLMNGSSCLEGSGTGLILTSPEGEEFTYALRFEFDASNNEAEYELVAGLRIAEQMGVKNLIAKVNSRLVANQINGLYEANEQSMTQCLEKAKTLINNFKMFSIEQPFYKWGIDISGPFPEGQGKIQTSGGNNIRQRKAIQRQPIQGLVREAEYQAKIGMPSIRCAKVNQAENDEELLLNLDILVERREKAAVHEARKKAKIEKYYIAKVRSTSFRPWDFVYRNNEASHAKESGKLGPKWEGPYEVVEALGKGVYRLRNRSGDVLPRTSARSHRRPHTSHKKWKVVKTASQDSLRYEAP